MATAYYSIDSDLIDSDLTNFPVGVKIESSTGFLSGLSSTDWQYIHATVGGVECYVEIELWDTTNEEAVLWVRVPTVSFSADTIIKIETGASNTSYVGETGDTAAQTVWDSNFAAVYHMAQDPSSGTGAILDSTSNAHHGTTSGSMTTSDLVSSGLGKGIEFDGGNDCIDISNLDNTNYSWTFEYQMSYTDDSNSAFLLDFQTGRFALAGNVSGTSGFSFYDGAWTRVCDMPSALSVLAMTLDASSYDAVAYINGSLAGTETGKYNSPKHLYGTGRINAAYNNTSPIICTTAEFRISNVVRSSAWIKATAYSLNDALLTYSATDPSGGGATEPTIGAEGLSFGETIGFNVEKSVSVSVGLSFSESAGINFVKNVGLTEGLCLAESATGSFGEGPEGEASEGLSLTEVIGRNIERTKGLFDSVGLSEIVGKNVESIRGLFEAIGFAEVVVGSLEAAPTTYEPEIAAQGFGLGDNQDDRFVAVPDGPLDDFRFNSSDMSPDITLENDELTVTTSGNTSGEALARTLGSKTTGKWYFELSIEAYSSAGYSVGWVNGGHELDGYMVGEDSSAYGVGFDCDSGDTHDNGTNYSYSSDTANDGDYVMVAADLDDGKFWFGINGVWLESGDPANGTNPAVYNFDLGGSAAYPAVTCNNTTSLGTCQATILTNTGAFLGTVPSGFSPLSDTVPAWNYGRLGFFAISDGLIPGIEQEAGRIDQIGFSGVSGGLNYTAWLKQNADIAGYRYYAKITGDADGLEGYSLTGLKNFQIRMRSSTSSYLSLSLDYNDSHLSAINSRPNGKIAVDIAAMIFGKESLREELLSATVESVRYDKGSSSRSITLTGYVELESSSGVSVLRGVTLETMLSTGLLRFRCAQPDFYLRPGDVATYEGGQITVDSVSISVSPTSQYMDVAE